MANKSLKVGVIGLGAMGKPCAFHILTAGYPLFVYARRKVSAEPLLSVGATWCETPEQLAQHVDVIVTNVSDTEDVEGLMFGEAGIMSGAKSGLIVVDMSTIAPLRAKSIASRAAERGVTFLDAPVSGGQIGAVEGRLTIMVGGDAAALETVRPILEVLGKSITHLGESGAGQVAKACNQIVTAVAMVGVAEAFSLASAMNVDISKVREALLGGFANSRVLELHGQRMIDQNFEPGFKAALHDKDMKIIQELAEKLSLKLSANDFAASQIARLVAEGDGALDSAAIYRYFQSNS